MTPTVRSSRTIRLPTADVEPLIQRLQKEATHAGAEGSEALTPLSSRNVSLQVAQPGGAIGQFLVDTVAVGPTRLHFIHGGFLHAGSELTVRLMTLDNAWRDIRGIVKSCRHVEKGIHEIVMTWEGTGQAIEVSEFIPSSAPKSRVLLVDDAAVIRQLVVHFLREFRANISQVETCAEARTAFASGCDVAYVDLELPDGDGMDLVRQWREEGSQCHMVALTGRTDAEERATIMAAGFDAFVGKPFTREILVASFKAAVSEAIKSPMAENPEMKPLCEAYVKDLPRLIDRVTKAMRAKDLAEITRVVHEIRSSAACYQFDPIAAAAADLTTGLKNAPDLDAAAQEVAKLISLCRRATAQ